MSGNDSVACILNMLIENLESISHIGLVVPSWKREYLWHGQRSDCPYHGTRRLAATNEAIILLPLAPFTDKF